MSAGCIVDMPDRRESGVDIPTVGSTGEKEILYSYPFKASPSLKIDPQDMQTGDTWSYLYKDETGFKVKFVNSLGAAVTRTFDYVADGYGRKL